MSGSLYIGKIGGISIYINFSWLIILVLLTWSLAVGWFSILYPGWSSWTYWIVSFASALLLFVSVLLHELAHSFVARSRGLPVKSITLFVFGGISNLEHEPQSAGVEFQMAVVGPLVSLLIGGVAFALMQPLRGSRSPVSALLGYLAVANILLGLLNLLPGFPLDGGRILRSIIWQITGSLRKSTRIASTIGQILAYLIILWGIWQFFLGNFLNGIWTGFIGWFLLNAAQSANYQVTLESIFRGVTVGEMMNPAPTTVPAMCWVCLVVGVNFLPHGLRSAFVTVGDQLIGLITLSDIRHVPREKWGQIPVGHAMIPLDRLHSVTPEQCLNDVLPLMVGQDINQLPVTQMGHLVGVLNRDAIVRLVEVRRSLGLDKAA